MSNIIKFVKPSSSAKRSDAGDKKALRREKAQIDRRQVNERIATLGGEAIESLSMWRTGLPMGDRIRMAKNMDGLIREYKIAPRKLDWEQHGYRDKESFNRDLSRMRMPETAEPGRRLLAHNTRWLQLLEMIQRYCEANDEPVTIEALGEKLLRGTRFHPTKRIHSRTEKLLYNLKLWANEIDEHCGLLKAYRQIAEARAEHFKLHMRDYWQDAPWTDDYLDTFEEPVYEFTNIPDEHLGLFQRQLGTYSDNDWETFLNLIPEDCITRYESSREQIVTWKEQFDPKTTLFGDIGNSGQREPSLSWWQDLEYLPRWFIGFYDCHDLKLLSNYPKETVWPAYFSCNTGTKDPLSTSFNEETRLLAYLVLYPNREMSRIIPYIYSITEEWSTYEVLTEHHLTNESELLFPEAEPQEDVISKTIQGRIEEDFVAVRQSWLDTASSLKKHPLIEWSKAPEAMIDAEIARLTSRPQISEKSGDAHDEK